MSKIGVNVLLLWLIFNFGLAVLIVLGMLIFGLNAPALLILFDSNSVVSIVQPALQTVNALAILMNTVIAVLCGFSILIIWKGFLKYNWIFWSLAVGLGCIQLGGFLSDGYLGSTNLLANLISSLILFTAFFLIKAKKRVIKLHR